MTVRAPKIGWQLPPFYCPLGSAVHPRASSLEDRAVTWLDECGLFHDEKERAWSIATNSTDFSCRIIPDGDDELLLLFIMWNHWAFLLDDLMHDTGIARTADIADLNIRISRCLEAPGSGLLRSDVPLYAGLEELAARTRAALTPTQLHRVAEGLRDWLWGAEWQVANLERGIMPELSDYVGIRPSVNGTRFSLAWSEIASGIAVPEEELYAPQVRALTDAAGFIVSCDNDLFSYAKEDDMSTDSDQSSALQEDSHATSPNLVNILARDNGCPPVQALGEAVAVRDRTMTLFLRLREQIARDAGPELGRYLNALGYYISGCIRWQNAAPRYASPRNRYELPVPGATFDITWTDTPADDRTDPLPIRATHWWWDQLDS